MTDGHPVLDQINLVVADMDATLAFYRRLGLDVTLAPGDAHAEVTMPNGMTLEFDTHESVRVWDSAWNGSTAGGAAVIGFSVATRERVDGLYAELVAEGSGGHQRPFDAFWGSRYAIVEDPDGNCVGLMSPRDPDRRSWPPTPPPST
ncbi:MAG TPA: VOC family protein [Acidimicrobiales bacterium]